MGRHALLGPAHYPARRAEFLRAARECSFDLRQLARRLQVSERTIKRFIRNSFDRAASDWLKEQRLNKSLFYLAESGSVKLAALKTGFKQQAHFSREFKRVFHVTPSSYLVNWTARNSLTSPDHSSNRKN